jgi:hypothetical protein
MAFLSANGIGWPTCEEKPGCRQAKSLWASSWEIARRQARQKSLAEQLHDRHAVPACEGKESIELGRRIGVDGFVLFSYGDVTKPSERAPAGDYLQRIGKAAFSAP